MEDGGRRRSEQRAREGDILVLDGTLQTGYGGEARLADALYGAARRRGVIVCALAKTTTMMGPGGVPVLYAAHEAARAAGLHTWYMPLARRVPGDGSGFVLAARLHRHSRFTYRLEVLRDQYDLLQGSGEIGGVIGSIAANSGDPSFPGSRTGWSARTGTQGCVAQRRPCTAACCSPISQGTRWAGQCSTTRCSCRRTRRSTGRSGGDDGYGGRGGATRRRGGRPAGRRPRTRPRRVLYTPQVLAENA